MTDGYLNFDTKINTSGFTSGLKKLAGALAIGATVKAAAGGTAISKLVKDMQLAVETGSEDLQQFANVAGVSAVPPSLL